jgi:hypothetical protein
MTLAELRRSAQIVWVGIDDDVPPGHFVAVADVLGISTSYLLAGNLQDEDAKVVGRIEHIYPPCAYRGNGLKGGRLLSHGSDPNPFNAMIRETS